MVLQKVQYCTNLYKRVPSSAKTLQFSIFLNKFTLTNFAYFRWFNFMANQKNFNCESLTLKGPRRFFLPFLKLFYCLKKEDEMKTANQPNAECHSDEESFGFRTFATYLRNVNYDHEFYSLNVRNSAAAIVCLSILAVAMVTWSLLHNFYIWQYIKKIDRSMTRGSSI
ncbi:hypothetical protein BpHYR1_047367 [Brachionus plicatilis]|uniref:Uncharacterized protein n=1 Tax=Brachionus plicatilis TaxID=10195 RepID=A0A3M7PHK8_BRAPC|nr:hypothetical protein BpHYR1_047367 [Brachionus plicatilis]